MALVNDNIIGGIAQNGARVLPMTFTFSLTAALQNAGRLTVDWRSSAGYQVRVPFQKVETGRFLMIKRALLAAAALGAVTAAPASAITVIATPGAFAAPATGGAGYSFDFNGGGTVASIFAAAGFTSTTTGTAAIRTGSDPFIYEAPTPGDNSPYVAVQADSTLSAYLAGGSFDAISLYVGSLDSFNSIAVLDGTGAVIQSYTGSALISPLTPDSQTSYRITFLRQAGDAAFGGISVTSVTNNAAEFDNLVFAVPEPSTWALMLAGFGMVGMAMRARRRRTNVVFA